ncbi:ABC transporter permease [Syntrophaceticus schinkii]|jgi:putative ABC transport system permease protein|nr:ABC transporter permease [Syntrophaceticus schinkii]
MMNFADLAQIVWENLRAHRMRAVLTTIGIAIGIAGVIAVVAVGQGGQAVIISEIEKMGSSRYFEIGADYMRGETADSTTFNLQDPVLIKELSPAVEKMAPLTLGPMVDIRLPHSQQKSIMGSLYGTTPDMIDAMNLTIEKGRFLSDTDVSAHARVVVIDAGLAADLFPKDDPLGKKVFVQDTPLTVIGVLEKAPSSMMDVFNLRSVYTPITFAQEMLNTRVISTLSGVAVSEEALPQAISDSIKILEKRHSRTSNHYMGSSLEEQLDMVGNVTSVLTTIIGAVAGIALLVGGVGVMNIMLVAVSERTREIGLLKALGARRRDIMQQFLGEAVALCLLGGLIGMIFGIGGAFAIALLANWPPLISIWTVLVALGFSVIIGIFFGLYPASRAASLSPAEALRHL